MKLKKITLALSALKILSKLIDIAKPSNLVPNSHHFDKKLEKRGVSTSASDDVKQVMEFAKNSLIKSELISQEETKKGVGSKNNILQ